MVLGVAVGLAAGGAITGAHELAFSADRSDEDRTTGTVNIIKATASEASMMARCTGKTNLQNVEPEDLPRADYCNCARKQAYHSQETQ